MKRKKLSKYILLILVLSAILIIILAVKYVNISGKSISPNLSCLMQNYQIERKIAPLQFCEEDDDCITLIGCNVPDRYVNKYSNYSEISDAINEYENKCVGSCAINRPQTPPVCLNHKCVPITKRSTQTSSKDCQLARVNKEGTCSCPSGSKKENLVGGFINSFYCYEPGKVSIASSKDQYKSGENVPVYIVNGLDKPISIRRISVGLLTDAVSSKSKISDNTRRDISCPCDADCLSNTISVNSGELNNQYSWDQISCGSNLPQENNLPSLSDSSTYILHLYYFYYEEGRAYRLEDVLEGALPKAYSGPFKINER
ncbi:MAG: hypothetical protein US54_C0024G0016 [Candidatus Roizmanbacteria bacterium GW2011_GWA2_37_7]|uniref:Uncharacterized protein n=1 Tax=Candidatus Roizmanbacteria bacterium GW2011_GWA2_37_7 TaxID=1618481 RepID=A0A0G0JM50_9BACT|nr:MAG: hypothetical protein US54_C0024G0016 [Candidatus Roizmanbacteria bacterium GW2011_GWA2_37_7]